MDQLWSPWRFRYVVGARQDKGCVLCEMAKAPTSENRERLIVHRASSNFVVLNLFPYTTGHTLIAPYAHGGRFDQFSGETLGEMMTLAQAVHAALQTTYSPEGYNLGINLGRCAGAGVGDHLHLHVVPRWTGDSNFMTVVGETRVQPEDLLTTYDKLARFFQR